MSWGAIFGGAVAALGIWTLLYALGLALGLTSMLNPANPSSARGAGIFTGIWGVISPLIALFFGGWVASRESTSFTRIDAGTHGLVMWGLTTVAGVFLVVSVLGTVVGAAASAGKAVVGAAGSAAAGVASAAGQNAFGLDADDALRPVNQRLAAEGKPTITTGQLQATVKDVLGDAVRQGRLDRDLLVSSLTQNTTLARQDAEEVAARIETQFNKATQDMKSRLQDIKQNVETGALKAAEGTGKAFWGVFGALFLGLISAILGAITGAERQVRQARERYVVPERGARVGAER